MPGFDLGSQRNGRLQDSIVGVVGLLGPPAREDYDPNTSE